MSVSKSSEYESDSISSFQKTCSRVIFVLLFFLYLLLVFPQKLYKVSSAPKRCHILLTSCQQTLAQFPTVFILFSLHRVIHLAANTKNGILIDEKILVLFSIAPVKFINLLKLTLNKVSCSHFLKKHVVPCRFLEFENNSRQKS